ncbi:hypothetical protein ASD62_16880 [Phycicoccus sp. Root563]|uniref:hypothetical protein n=1 Tax=unclassified Phycicoccus TaxID=2637926 RepID=UPI000702F6D9|nr:MULTISPECIES: hypothetical protein [unclassified Phycicoccus]KQU69493.1 hypothetical protein ASC58_06360 [Phycicoccus sp. Root101]KQZ90719.1 hypothetical protein ASD62_16880 [Phycicoccus sp. Root563]
MTILTKALTRAQYALHGAARRDERGDVPGWVMITLMTAGLVAVLWTVADDQLRALFNRAMGTVSGP